MKDLLGLSALLLLFTPPNSFGFDPMTKAAVFDLCKKSPLLQDAVIWGHGFADCSKVSLTDAQEIRSLQLLDRSDLAPGDLEEFTQLREMEILLTSEQGARNLRDELKHASELVRLDIHFSDAMNFPEDLLRHARSVRQLRWVSYGFADIFRGLPALEHLDLRIYQENAQGEMGDTSLDVAKFEMPALRYLQLRGFTRHHLKNVVQLRQQLPSLKAVVDRAESLGLETLDALKVQGIPVLRQAKDLDAFDSFRAAMRIVSDPDRTTLFFVNEVWDGMRRWSVNRVRVEGDVISIKASLDLQNQSPVTEDEESLALSFGTRYGQVEFDGYGILTDGIYQVRINGGLADEIEVRDGRVRPLM